MEGSKPQTFKKKMIKNKIRRTPLLKRHDFILILIQEKLSMDIFQCEISLSLRETCIDLSTFFNLSMYFAE